MSKKGGNFKSRQNCVLKSCFNIFLTLGIIQHLKTICWLHTLGNQIKTSLCRKNMCKYRVDHATKPHFDNTDNDLAKI